MENNNLQTPRFNLVQLMGITWLSPFLVIAIIFTISDARIILAPLLIALISLIVGLGFFLKKKWVRYLTGIGLTGCSILLLIIGIELLSRDNFRHYFLDNIAIGCTFFIFIIGFFLLTFNIGTAIEFERLAKVSIDYTTALKDAQENMRYYFKNTVDLTTSFGLILIAPSFILLFVLYKEISRGSFSLENNGSIFLVAITFGSLVCGISAFLKLKISRYFTLIIFILIFLFSLSEVNVNLSQEDLIITAMLFLVGILFGFSILAMLFHPLTTYFFDNTIKHSEDYDDILDFE